MYSYQAFIPKPVPAQSMSSGSSELDVLEAWGLSGLFDDVFPATRGGGWRWTVIDIRFLMGRAFVTGADRSSQMAQAALATVQARLRANYQVAGDTLAADMPWDHVKAQIWLDRHFGAVQRLGRVEIKG